MYVVYGLSVGVGGTIRYVGLSTKGAEERLRQHCIGARMGLRLPVYDWMRKYGLENIATRVLCCTIDEADLRLAETWWIAAARAAGLELLNCTDGGDGVINPGAETRRRMGAANVGRRNSADARARQAAKLRGRKRAPFTEEHRANIAQAARGKILSDVDRAKRSAANRGLHGDDAYLTVLAEWTLCSDCGYRYGYRQLREHRVNGQCQRASLQANLVDSVAP